MTDQELDYVESRLYRGFGVEVRPDLQIRAEIILQRKTVGLGVHPRLNDLAEGINSILQNSNPGAGWPFRPRSSNTSGCSVHRVGSVSAGAFS
jgi:hypothetical protein